MFSPNEFACIFASVTVSASASSNGWNSQERK